MMFWSRAYAKHLEAEILWLRQRAEVAEQKAAIAVAELVRLQTAGQANVAPRPLMAEREVNDPYSMEAQALQQLRNNPEWSQAGS